MARGISSARSRRNSPRDATPIASLSSGNLPTGLTLAAFDAIGECSLDHRWGSYAGYLDVKWLLLADTVACTPGFENLDDHVMVHAR